GDFRFRFAVVPRSTIIIVALIWQFIIVPPVSASEVLRRSIEAQTSQINQTPEPVLHQRITVVRTSSNSDRLEPTTWEIWNDTKNGRLRVSEPGAVATGSDASTTPGGAINNLRAVLRNNHMK